MRIELETKKLAVNKSAKEIGKITASFGIAQLSVGEDAPKLVQRADAKLYECAGRSGVVAAERAAASCRPSPRSCPACRVPLQPRSG